VRSFKIVFDQPFGEIPVKYITVSRPVSKSNEFLLKRAIEPLIESVVLGSPGARKILVNFQ
jgi:hypothetical protein